VYVYSNDWTDKMSDMLLSFVRQMEGVKPRGAAVEFKMAGWGNRGRASERGKCKSSFLILLHERQRARTQH